MPAFFSLSLGLPLRCLPLGGHWPCRMGGFWLTVRCLLSMSAVLGMLSGDGTNGWNFAGLGARALPLYFALFPFSSFSFFCLSSSLLHMDGAHIGITNVFVVRGVAGFVKPEPLTRGCGRTPRQTRFMLSLSCNTALVTSSQSCT
ncbi:hypothetical protein B0J11DRAFT_70755 [Dendryphion nanum]|uniref:Uncharacterized protein n=1 Tax=Dendryphion nanum TaxID=256645 RepID=A0A9P9DIW2_9PLEO|nr:hypothetical protein B0J11DRAFT_70755 [Dendryphion nanum]